MHRIVYFLVLFVISGTLSAQFQTGRITGTITDSQTSESLPGATIRVEGTNIGAAADMDGRFVINNVSLGKKTLVVSYISYKTKIMKDIAITPGTTELYIQLEPVSGDSLQVVVVTTLDRSASTTQVLMQRNNGAVSDGTSAEAITRSPDRNSSDVLKRVSGVTIQDDKYVVIRGLSERYNSSYLNGAPLPSTEPDKKAFAYNLFPSNIIENIVVNKTATPDMPSEFAGGIVQINTKSSSEKNFLSLNTGTGYNSITTLQNRMQYEGGKYDLMGFDDGSRAIPSALPGYLDRSSWITNDAQANMAKNFANDWSWNNSRFMPNSMMQLTGGYKIKRKEEDFIGIIFGAGYNSNKSLYTMDRTEYDGMVVGNLQPERIIRERNYSSLVNQTQNSTGLLLNLSARFNDNNKIVLKSFMTGSTDDKFIFANGSNDLTNDNVVLNRVTTRYFSYNRIITSQLNGEHFFEKSGLKFEWNLGIGNVIRSVPNFRNMSYSRYDHFNEYDPSEGPNLKDTVYKADISTSTGPSYAGYRVYNQLNENIYSSRFDVSKTYTLNQSWELQAKTGVLYQFRDRTFLMRSFGMQQYSATNKGIFADDSLLYLSESQIFATQNMGVTPVNTGGFKLFENTKADDNYRAKSNLGAGYIMGELKHTEKFRAIGGLRYENYSQLLTVAYNFGDSVYVKNSLGDFLPSLNLVYNLNKKTGLRASYYKTLNRPEFRELAKINWFDPETRLSVSGNPDLVRSYIQNMDLRFEHYPGKGQLITVSSFYKYFVNPIERYMQPGQESQIIYRNANYAQVYGAEMEYRVNLAWLLNKDSVRVLNNISLFSNLSLIKSKVNVEGLNDKVANSREMQGQAPYIVNAGITYNDVTKGHSMTLMVNRAGPKIYIVGNDQIPDRWESARTVVDFQASKMFLKKKLEIKLNVKDILQQKWVVFYRGSSNTLRNYNPDTDYVNFVRNYGTTYSFSISYKF